MPEEKKNEELSQADLEKASGGRVPPGQKGYEGQPGNQGGGGNKGGGLKGYEGQPGNQGG